MTKQDKDKLFAIHRIKGQLDDMEKVIQEGDSVDTMGRAEFILSELEVIGYKSPSEVKSMIDEAVKKERKLNEEACKDCMDSRGETEGQE